MDNIVCDDDCCYIVDNSESNLKNMEKIKTEKLAKIALKIPMPSDKIEWTIYGTKWCPYCIKANTLLNSQDSYQYIDIEEYINVSDFKKLFDERTNGYSTIPMIFNKETFIGGYSDLLEWPIY